MSGRTTAIVVLVCLGVAAIIVLMGALCTNPKYACNHYPYIERECPANILDGEKFDCFPNREEPTERECLQKGCCYQQTSSYAPQCYYPARYGYRLEEEPESIVGGFRFILVRLDTPKWIRGHVYRIHMVLEFQSDNRMRFKIWNPDPELTRFESPFPKMPKADQTAVFTQYRVTWTADPFSLKVTRASTGTVLFDSSVGGFVFAKQFLQMSSRLATQNIYGIGEHSHESYIHFREEDVLENRNQWKKWGIFNRYGIPEEEDAPKSENLYGAHPYFMCLESDGNAHGILFLNTNPMEMTLQPLAESQAAVTWRTIGGIMDFWIFLGPTPEDVVSQYTEAVGRPFMPPYWGLGFGLGRWGYGGDANMEFINERNREAGIPIDIQYTDIDSMDTFNSFTYDRTQYGGLPSLVDRLHNDFGQHVVAMIHPGVSTRNGGVDQVNTPLTEGTDSDVWVRNHNRESPLEGRTWPGQVYFPDFTKTATENWWSDQCANFHQDVAFDGMIVEGNEPLNFDEGTSHSCRRNYYNFPNYVPDTLVERNRRIWAQTMCLDADHSIGEHIDVHNVYGLLSAKATFDATWDVNPDMRPVILSRSTFVGSGQYAGHWLGDNAAIWPDLHRSIIGMLEFNLFGIPYVGADICGFFGESRESLCQRWMQLGAFYPLSRNHNAYGTRDQDPAEFSEETLESSRIALEIRYTLLPYLYSLFYHAHVNGTTVARPLFHEFPTDKETWDIDKQFLWGPSVMISPVLEENSMNVEAYLPNDRWYDWYTTEAVDKTNQGKYLILDAPTDMIPIHIRGGSILPYAVPDRNTFHSRRHHLGLLVALQDRELPEDQKIARGDLFWDDGEARDTYERNNDIYMTFEATEDYITFIADRVGYFGENRRDNINWLPRIENITIFGVPQQPEDIDIDDIELDRDQIEYEEYDYVAESRTYFTVTLIRVDLSITEDHDIKLTYDTK